MVGYMEVVYPEVYVWVVLALGSIIARYVSRRLLVRRWNFQADDWLMLVVAFFYISAIAFGQAAEIYNIKVNVDPLPDNIEELDFWAYMFNILFDHTVIATVWLCKACMLILLYRMTLNLKQNVAIRVIAVITALSWVFLLVGFLTWCYPLEEYVLFEVTNDQCETPTKFLISLAVCNIATDILIIMVTVPMFWQSRIPMKKKIPIIILFSLGLVTIAITAAGRILPLTDFGANIMLWVTREASLSIIITNLPLTMPFFARLRKSTSKWTSSGPLTWLRSQSTAKDSGCSKSGISKPETYDNGSLASAGQSIYKDVEFSTTYSEKHEFSDITYPQAQPVDFTRPVPKAYAV